MKITLTKEMKVMFLNALKDGFIETRDLEKVIMKEIPTFYDALVESGIIDEENPEQNER